MNKPSPLRFMVGVVILLSFVRVTHAGGSDIVTLKDFPIRRRFHIAAAKAHRARNTCANAIFARSSWQAALYGQRLQRVPSS